LGKTRVLATRVSEPFYRVVQAYLSKSAHINEADLVRAALIRYLRDEAPSLYRNVMGIEEGR